MRVKIDNSGDGIYGITLLADSPIEKDILLRFRDGGIKINTYSERWLQLTFKDLIGHPERLGIQAERGKGEDDHTRKES
jgi:hypothetical protein